MNLNELVERVKGHTQAPDDPPTCCNCGDEYSLRDGCEVTDFCDPCAQELAPSLLTLALELTNQIAIERERTQAEKNHAQSAWYQRDKSEAELTTLRASLEQARRQSEASVNAEKQDCHKTLFTLAGAGICTPEEGYGSNSSWAIGDLCRAVNSLRAELEQVRGAARKCDMCREPVTGSVHFELVSGAHRCCSCMRKMELPPTIGGPAQEASVEPRR